MTLNLLWRPGRLARTLNGHIRLPLERGLEVSTLKGWVRFLVGVLLDVERMGQFYLRLRKCVYGRQPAPLRKSDREGLFPHYRLGAGTDTSYASSNKPSKLKW